MTTPIADVVSRWRQLANQPSREPKPAEYAGLGFSTPAAESYAASFKDDDDSEEEPAATPTVGVGPAPVPASDPAAAPFAGDDDDDDPRVDRYVDAFRKMCEAIPSFRRNDLFFAEGVAASHSGERRPLREDTNGTESWMSVLHPDGAVDGGEGYTPDTAFARVTNPQQRYKLFA